MQPMPDIAALLKIAQSPAGQQLLTLLKSNNSADLDSIATAAAAGHMEEAKQKLSSLLSSQDAQALLKQLEKSL